VFSLLDTAVKSGRTEIRPSNFQGVDKEEEKEAEGRCEKMEGGRSWE